MARRGRAGVAREVSTPRGYLVLAAMLAISASRPGVCAADPVRSEQLAVADPGGPNEWSGFTAWPLDTGVADDEDQKESWLVPTFHGLGLMTGMRLVEAALWPDPFASTDWASARAAYEEAYTRPPVWDSSERPFEWDDDRWTLNVVGHGLFGSELYLRARTCGKGVLEAFAFTAAGSTLWEYGFEANAVRPSGLDLWYTPLAGLVLGEARHWAWRAAGTIASHPWRTVTRALLDPFGELERAGGAPC